MRAARYLWLANALLLLSCLGPTAGGEERSIFQIGGGVGFSGTNSHPVSCGHAYLVSGEPGCVFGGAQDRSEKWKLNYLVLIKHNATALSDFHKGHPDPAKSSASSDGKVRLIDFHERIRFDTTSVTFSYQAQFDMAKDSLISDEMTFQGKRIDLTDGRVFVVDMTVEPVRFRQVNVKLPASEDLDFLKIPLEQYKVLTNRWLGEIAKNSEVVAETFSP